jgi:hypothetical protein
MLTEGSPVWAVPKMGQAAMKLLSMKRAVLTTSTAIWQQQDYLQCPTMDSLLTLDTEC